MILDDDTDRCSSGTEEYLDLADLNDFRECNSIPLWHEEKLKAIETLIATRSDPISDRATLRLLCCSRGGLLNDELRKQIWPWVVDYQPPVSYLEISPKAILDHTYYNQVILDVQRILKRFPPGLSETVQSDLQIKVTDLIIKVLIVNDGYHYYQGFHDIAITLLLAVGEEMSFNILCKLAQTHFQLFMGKDMEPTMEILNLVYVVIKKENPSLYEYLVRSELGTIFCLPWALTWFGHVLNDYDTVARLFDVFISSHPWTSMYLSAMIVLYRANEIFSTPCEMPLLHHLLTNVPEDLPFDVLITEAEKLAQNYPPAKITQEIKDLHAENVRRAEEEQERLRKIVEARKSAKLQTKTRTVVKQNWRSRWVAIPRSLPSGTLRLVALSVSVATVAIICSYIKPSFEIP